MAYILIIEDDRDIRNVTELILTEAGHTVICATDGLNGVALAASIKPDLILMDLALPRLDGWQATRHLKADTATHGIPIIAFTAHVSKSDAKQALMDGCETIVAKPFELHALLNAITSVLGQQAHP